MKRHVWWKILWLSGALLNSNASQSAESWLSICSDAPASVLENANNSVLAQLENTAETLTVLQITPNRLERAACESQKLPFSRDAVLWGRFVNRDTPLAPKIALQIQEKKERFTVTEVIPLELPQRAPAAVLPQTFKPKHPVNRVPPLRSAWFWSAAAWLETPQIIFKKQAALKLNRIYITVPTSEGVVKNAAQLRQFLHAAHAQGLQVWSVMGDARAVLEQEKTRTLSLVSAYQAFNSEKNATQRLDGLQLDIEPYLLPSYQTNPAMLLQKQAQIINAIHRVTPSLALDVVLPFWFDPARPDEAQLLNAIEPAIASLTIMDYRTDPEQIRTFAEKFLAWGETKKKLIAIALESSPLPEETRRVYREANKGELWSLPLKSGSVLLLLKQETTALPSVKTYCFSHAQKIDGSNTSFFQKTAELAKILPPLEKDFSVWSSFAGIAFHGID